MTVKISTKGRYALRLMLDLAVHGGDGLPVSLKDVSRRQQLSDKYLEQIVTPLSKAGLVRSMRGAGGGYLLTRRPEEYTVGRSCALWREIWPRWSAPLTRISVSGAVSA